MASFDASTVPRCTIDFPLEFSAQEISFLSGPVNTLLKSSYLLGTSFETDAILNSLFDIAQEIAGAEACGYLSRVESDPDSWEIRISRRIESHPSPECLACLVAPGAIVARFGKAISMDPEWGSWSEPICKAWASRSLVTFPVLRDRDIAGAVVFGKRESHPFTAAQTKLLWALSLQVETHLQRAATIEITSPYTFLDPLTHLFNRRFFRSQLEREVQRSRRNGESFSLLLLDVDGFREYNDRSTSGSGDIALQEIAGILNGCVREVDTVARLGDNDFAILLVETDGEGAHALAQRIVQRVQRQLFPVDKETRTARLTASVGFASFPADAFDADDLMSKADSALHAARGKGRGQICSYQDATEPASMKHAVKDLPVRKIYDAGRSVVDMDKFLEILLFTAMQGLSAERGSIVVKGPEGDFSLRAAIGFSRYEEHATAQGGGRPGTITTWVVEHQLPLVVSKPEDSPFGGPFKKNGYKTESFLSIPLTHRGKTHGAIHLTNRRDRRPFSHDDLKTFAPIAAEIAGIIEQGLDFRENVRRFSLSILSSLSNAIEYRYPFLSGHSARVRELAVRTGERMGFDHSDLASLGHAAFLHDVGIAGIPGNLLVKKRPLSDPETDMVRKHPFLGSKMLEGVPGMEGTRRAILEHHERWDGSGYPYGLRGDDISLPARILSVAECYDSAVSNRPHRSPLKPEEALQMVRTGAGTLFDPEVARLFEPIPQVN